MQCHEKENHLIIKIHLSQQTAKNFYKFMPMNINQHIITLNIEKTPHSDIFKFYFNFELKIAVFDDVYAYLILQSAVVFPS